MFVNSVLWSVLGQSAPPYLFGGQIGQFPIHTVRLYLARNGGSHETIILDAMGLWQRKTLDSNDQNQVADQRFSLKQWKIRGVFCHLVVIYCTKLSKYGETFRVRIRVSVRLG